MSKNERTGCIVIVVIALILAIMFWAIMADSPSTSEPKTETCGFCNRTFKQGTDDYRSVIRRNLCTNCYNNMKWAEGALS